MFLKGMQSANPNGQTGRKMPRLPKLKFQWTGYKRWCQYSYLRGTDGRIGQNSAETRTDSIMVLNVSGKIKA